MKGGLKRVAFLVGTMVAGVCGTTFEVSIQDQDGKVASVVVSANTDNTVKDFKTQILVGEI